MSQPFIQHLQKQLAEIEAAGLYKKEREITSPQNGTITIAGGKKVLNFCANNYLGLADDPRLVHSAKASLDKYGFGMSSVRFICGTQTIHHELEKRLASFLGMESTILYSSCWDANGGLFETILGAEDAIISDALNHASIIDGIRLCKAKRLRYNNCDMADLEAKLIEAEGSRFKLIATDGVFSMDGSIAPLKAICDLADKYGAMVMVDDSHAVGFIGEKGKGTPEFCGVMGRIDFLTGTFGKALGGASGGYTCAKKEVIELLKQRSRPYLFSNTLAPVITATTLSVLDLLESAGDLRQKLMDNSHYFREKMSKLGFKLLPGQHPIIPVMLGDAKLAQQFASKMLEHGVYVVGFFYPVVPQGLARIRTQMSAAHSKEDLDRAIAAFERVGKELNILS